MPCSAAGRIVSRTAPVSDDLAHESRMPINPPADRQRGSRFGQARTWRRLPCRCWVEHRPCARLSQTVQSLLFLAPLGSLSPRIERRRSIVLRGTPPSRISTSRWPPNRASSSPPAPTRTHGRGGRLCCSGGGQSRRERHRAYAARRFIRVRGRDAGTSLSIEVADTGHGHPAEHLPDVSIGSTGSSRIARPLAGLGLGPAIVKSIALLHGGSVEIESAVAAGTRVRAVLPRRDTTRSARLRNRYPGHRCVRVGSSQSRAWLSITVSSGAEQAATSPRCRAEVRKWSWARLGRHLRPRRCPLGTRRGRAGT